MYFLQPQAARGFSVMTGIWALMVMAKKVCQRLRWDLICSTQLIGLKKRIHLGVSSSWDSRKSISVLSTESSTVSTMLCCERRLDCSARCEPANISLRSGKVWQWLSICWVTLCYEGMTVTSALETELSSRTKEALKRRLSCGMGRGVVYCCWETPSWELSPPLPPTLTCDWDDVSLQLRSDRSLEWMSRRIRSGVDDHEDGSLTSSLGNHKPWCSWEKAPSQATNRVVVV
jgi:hypothetical protein